MRILVAYATKYGSTIETSEFVKTTLEKQGHEVDMKCVSEIEELNYDFVIIGSSIRVGKVLAETYKFVKKFANQIQNINNALFVHCVSIKNETPENLDRISSSIKPVLSLLNSENKPGIFGGKVDYDKLGWLSLNLAKRDKTGFMAEGDWRDWKKIKKWVIGLDLNY